MKIIGDRRRLSASDLANFLACRHLTRLDLLSAGGHLRAPRRFDLGFQALIARGEAHEKTVLERFRSDEFRVVQIDESAEAEAATATAEALRSGADVVYQGVLMHETVDGESALLGRPDFLVRADLLAARDGEPRPSPGYSWGLGADRRVDSRKCS